MPLYLAILLAANVLVIVGALGVMVYAGSGPNHGTMFTKYAYVVISGAMLTLFSWTYVIVGVLG